MAGRKAPSAWLRPPAGTREQPVLSLDQIVRQAMRVLDAEGLDALSMRRLGTELGAGATSVYTYVADKDELIERVADQAFGEVPLPPEDGGTDWRAGGRAAAHGFRAMVLGHPWLASVLGEIGLAYLGPNMMRLMDRLLGVFEAGGFTPAEAEHATSTLMAYVVGVCTSESAWQHSLTRSGETAAAWLDRLWPLAQAAAEPYPRLRALYAGEPRGGEGSQEQAFEEGVGILLDGLAVRYARG